MRMKKTTSRKAVLPSVVWVPIWSTRVYSTTVSLRQIRGGPSPISPTEFPYPWILILTTPSLLSMPVRHPAATPESVPQETFAPYSVDGLAVPASWGKSVASVSDIYSVIYHEERTTLNFTSPPDSITTCGGTVTLNNTYWQSPSTAVSAPSTCALTVRMDTKLVEQLAKPICQIR